MHTFSASSVRYSLVVAISKSGKTSNNFKKWTNNSNEFRQLQEVIKEMLNKFISLIFKNKI